MNRFFISGCQRSGTTMLRLILESHPSIQCFDEADGYSFLISESKGETPKARENMKNRLTGFKIPRFAEQLTWLEFSDPDYGVFPSFYKSEKVIHLIRDPLDVIGSMMKLRTADGISWIERYGENILENLIAHPNFDLKYKEEYIKLKKNTLPIHFLGGLYWLIKNQGYYDLVSRGFPVLLVCYESLTRSPGNELSKIVKFLDLDWSETLLHHPDHPHVELDDNGFAIGSTDPLRSIDVNSIGGHHMIMSVQQIREAKLYVEELSLKFGHTPKT